LIETIKEIVVGLFDPLVIIMKGQLTGLQLIGEAFSFIIAAIILICLGRMLGIDLRLICSLYIVIGVLFLILALVRYFFG
jgi:hypothetical protein